MSISYLVFLSHLQTLHSTSFPPSSSSFSSVTSSLGREATTFFAAGGGPAFACAVPKVAKQGLISRQKRQGEAAQGGEDGKEGHAMREEQGHVT